MTNAEEIALSPDYLAPRGTPSARTPLGDLFMPLAGLVDVEVERARLEKEVAKAQGELDAATRKLASPQFVQGAPPAVVEEHRRRQAEAESRLQKLRGMLEALAGGRTAG